MVPSYGGWTSFKGLPLTAWNMNSYRQIGDACGGLVEVSKSTMRKTDLIEVRLKIRHNYTGFIPAQINIKDSKGNIFTIQTVSFTEERWFKERNANIHSYFTRQAALEFNEFDFEAEKYSFMGFVVTPPKKKDKKLKKTLKHG
ncbi:putative amidohydrolase ytcJ [Cucumis melo var. makuwa]|uniref:Amidohydrolase ytcJ n=1 Tax=Cucumis melo var. makuwa TaxID=1194695 RepID=A0A5D3DT94_CUCMM|nr:putative amidohydrolase ytcJ [Cucumis melo var. makuwa]TYK26480.1 putative amidohydrolase ytcJ [Cucumis melo var. makuwa]